MSSIAELLHAFNHHRLIRAKPIGNDDPRSTARTRGHHLLMRLAFGVDDPHSGGSGLVRQCIFRYRNCIFQLIHLEFHSDVRARRHDQVGIGYFNPRSNGGGLAVHGIVNKYHLARALPGTAR